ncbi:MAG TPA: BTAD domain-containing putative transcriptional regulator [Thermoleophilaceae bacterium]|nr:BTAD domain-containing putative transcriptional regulator [Thermoleophilaceae bacterium]
MDFRILGPLEVRAGQALVGLGGAKQRSLLAILLLNANEMVTTERLVDTLWGERPPPTAVKTVQVYVSQLRKELGAETIVTRPGGYALEVDPDRVDLNRFEALAQRGRSALTAGDAGVAAAALREALELWRGPPLSDLAYEAFVQAEAARLEELRLTALEDRIEADLRSGRAAELVSELQALAASHPLRERLRAQLMLALYRSGRQAEALEAYQLGRRHLVDELGIEPGRELRELEQAILSQDPALDPDQATAPGRPHGKPFVGRKRELAELTGGLRRAVAGRGATFMVGGEPGIGKTRLAGELSRAAQELGATPLWGRCWEAGGAPAFWPWVQAIRAYARTREPDELRTELGSETADVAQIVPELADLLGADAPSFANAPGARFRVFDATGSFLRRAAGRRPLLLLLDDLHAADESSLLLLRFVAGELADSPIMVVGFHRDTDLAPGQPLAGTLAELAREQTARRLSMRGLSKEEVGDFIELATGSVAPARAVDAVFEQTEGNPLFVEEVVRLLGPEPAGGGRALSVAVIPDSVREVIARRLTRLSPDQHEVLTIAAVTGRDFELPVVAAVVQRRAVQLAELLDDAVAAGLISPIPGERSRFRFSHALVREVLYEGLSAANRARLHLQVAEALEDLHAGDLAPRLAELAHHFCEANPFLPDPRAAGYARRAAERAADLLAYEEAARLFRMAYESLVAGAEPEERCELLLSQGEVLSRAGDMKPARDVFLEAADLARRSGLSEGLARAALGYGGRFVWARAAGDRRMVPLMEEALAALGEGDSPLRARLLARLSGALRDEPSPARRDRLSEQAVEVARRLGEPATLCWCLDARHLAIFGPDTAERRIELADEMLRLATESGQQEPELLARDYRLYAFLQLGQLAEVETELQATVDLAESMKQPAYWWKVRAVEALLALLQGRFDAAQQSMEQAAELGRTLQSGAAATTHRLQRFALAWARGSLADVEEGIRVAAASSPTYVVWRCVQATVSCELGRFEEAGDVLDRLAAGSFERLHRDDEWLLSMSLLASVAAALEDGARARALYDALLPYGSQIAFGPPEFSVGSVSRPLGILASTLELWDDAEEHFTHAQRANEAMLARPWAAHTELEWARSLLRRGRSRDRPRAGVLASKASETFRELGMKSWSQRAEAVAAESRATPV